MLWSACYHNGSYCRGPGPWCDFHCGRPFRGRPGGGGARGGGRFPGQNSGQGRQALPAPSFSGGNWGGWGGGQQTSSVKPLQPPWGQHKNGNIRNWDSWNYQPPPPPGGRSWELGSQGGNNLNAPPPPPGSWQPGGAGGPKVLNLAGGKVMK